MFENDSSDELSSDFNSFSVSPGTNCVSSDLSPAVQINGRKVIGPPLNWIGPPPSTACELFLKKIPKSLAEYEIVPHFLRFGPIYEFRLMMDFNDCNRGYGYVKYTKEDDAARAMEVMNHFYILPGKVMEIQHSYDKCRLFVGNIPKHLTKEEIELAFRAAFPKLERVVMHNRISDGNKNRGFVFIDFPDHQEALQVKKQTTPGRLRKWGRDLKIVWANPERCIDSDSMKNVKTLFVRNIDLSVNTRELYGLLVPHIERTEICKISRVREFAFIDFASRNAAEIVLSNLQGKALKGHQLEFEWAMPPSENSVHTLKNSDFDAVLRIKCIANYWTVPIIIFGRVFERERLQYAAAMLRSNDGVRAVFVELQTENLSDIHSRLCEVVVTLIEQHGGLPSYNYVIKVKDESAHIVGAILDFKKILFVKASGLLHDLFLYWDEIKDLCMAVGTLADYSDAQILQMYENTLSDSSIHSYIDVVVGIDRIFGCLKPNYRYKPPLKYNLNNTQITLVLCHISTFTNYIFPNNFPSLYNFRDSTNNINVNSGICYSNISLLPTHFAQSRNNEIIISTVYYGIYRPNVFMPSPNVYQPFITASPTHLIGENLKTYYIPSHH